MKELSIEQKAKRYDKALEKSKRLYEQGTITESLAYIFPELKKSEDEKIRKDLIIYLRSILSNKKYGDKFIEGWIAWLEKQGKIVDYYEDRLDECACKYFNKGYKHALEKQVSVDEDEIVKGIRRGVAISLMNHIDANSKGMCLSNMECEDIENAIVNEDWNKVYGYMKKKLEKQGQTFTKKDVDDAYLKGVCDAKQELEKQGEQKPILDFKASGRYVSIVDGKIHNIYHSVDKIEPKFKVGDWIVKNDDSSISTDYTCCKITKVENGKYTIESIYGYKDYNTFETFENDYHLWTIQDAKDGDVLVASDKSLFIYDGSINENFSVGFHIAFTECMDIILNSDDGCGWEEKDSCHPATKEQRDTLEKAMADAGYTFDFEKKELKKIEQSPIDVRTTGYWHVEDVEQNHTWSEEDKEMLEDTCRILSNSKECTTSNVRWLKSLKDRYAWKPSDEQMEELSVAKDSCFDLSYKTKDALKSLYNDLKKLKG